MHWIRAVPRLLYPAKNREVQLFLRKSCAEIQARWLHPPWNCSSRTRRKLLWLSTTNTMNLEYCERETGSPLFRNSVYLLLVAILFGSTAFHVYAQQSATPATVPATQPSKPANNPTAQAPLPPATPPHPP